jgi:uncharacterized protein YpmB
MKTRKAFLILAAALSAASLYADKVSLPSAPKSVQDAIRSRAGRVQIEDLERTVNANGQVTYQAIWKANGTPQELVVSEAGTIVRDAVGPVAGLAGQNFTLANKTGIALTDTPLAVQNAINSQLLGAPIDTVVKGIWNNQNIYEVTYHQNGRLANYQVTETGQPVVSLAPATTWIPRYAGLAESNVAIKAAAKMAFTESPRPVQNTVNLFSRGARIEDFQRGTWNDRAVYEAAFKRNGQMVRLQVLDDGSLLTRGPQPEMPPLPAVGAPAAAATGTVPSD